MFTGIIEEVGSVAEFRPQSSGARLVVKCGAILQDATLGASIAVNGACLTATKIVGDNFTADLAPETLARTNLGALNTASLVNLERPLRANARLDGHFVLGHVDGTAEILALDNLGNGNWWLRFRLPKDLTRYVVSKGSIALDGISLTIATVSGDEASVTIIPHTFEHTNLKSYKAGARLNVEVDILAKHLEKLTQSDRRESLPANHPG